MKNIIVRFFALLFYCCAAQSLANTITIYHDADYSIHAESAQSMSMGFKPALAEVNDKIQGYDVKLVTRDHRGNSKRMMGEESLMRTVAEAFVLDMNGMVEQLKTYVDGGDMQNVGALGHKIKGAASAMGRTALSATALQIEQAGKAEQPERLDETLPLLEQCYDELQHAMRELLG
ncbi:MAG: hypothetical protein GWP56_03705 [Gammaproteobacteria bacterium]|nr:hypothetical protein [Gammaproteobacteria bacterium]